MPAREIEPDFLERLGRIITQWAFVEATESEMISHLLDADPGGMYVMTQSVSGKTLTDWIRTLVPIRLSHPESQKRIKTLLTEIDEARAERNALAHGLWSTDTIPGSVAVQTVRWERSEVVKTEIWTAADLDELIDRILHISTELTFLRKRFEQILRN